MNDCVVLSDDATEFTTTVSLVSEQSALCVEPTLFGSPVAGVYVTIQWYVPGASGVKLAGPYEALSPLTFTDCGLVPLPVASVVQSACTSSNESVPPAAAPAAVGLIVGEPGWCDVPVSDAVSVTGLPRTTSAPAVVARVGVTGLIVKHSLAPEVPSSASGTPLVDDVKCADQQ